VPLRISLILPVIDVCHLASLDRAGGSTSVGEGGDKDESDIPG
jgi:hypothetical protein